MAAPDSTLYNEALKRKERLNAMRQRRSGASNAADGSIASVEALPKPVFRSYKPLDETLRENVLPSTKPEEVKDKIRDQLEAAKSQPVLDEVDITNLAGRKPDWDLKRASEKKLKKLERRTQRAIAELIRDRLQSTKDADVDLARAVNSIGNG